MRLGGKYASSHTHGILLCHLEWSDVLRRSNDGLNAMIQRSDSISAEVRRYVDDRHFGILRISQREYIRFLRGLPRSLVRPIIGSKAAWLDIDDPNALERPRILCYVCFDVEAKGISRVRTFL